LIEAMRVPAFYPTRPPVVEFRQTHISYVFLAGDSVYKVKKPVRFTFLDYSSLKQRRFYCREEARLNRRLAPDVYLGVLPIFERDGSFLLGRETDESDTCHAAEYTVKMRRLPEDRMLDALVRGNGVDPGQIDAITRRLVTFHAAAGTERSSLYGTPDGIWRRLADNFVETEDFIGKGLSARRFRNIEAYSRGFIDGHRHLFAGRIKEGRIREGHGDLRAEHICLSDDVLIFDCIEFDERLRYCDVASELAFLAMDLDFLGAPGLSRYLTDTYASVAGDDNFHALLPFYKCYRAFVRVKVESLKSREREVPLEEREQARAAAGKFLRLSHRYARGSPRPAMLVVYGMVGSGKSTVARALGDLSAFDIWRSDVTRKKLAGVPPTFRAAAGFRSGLYGDRFTENTYGALLEAARNSLKSQRGVIVDATFRDPAHRRLFSRAAENLGVPVLFVECRAREDEILRRLREREKRPEEVSDANVEVYLRQRDDFAPLAEIPGGCHVRVDTEADLDEELEKVEACLYSQ